MKNVAIIALAVVLSTAASLYIMREVIPASEPVAHNESAFDRTLRTGILRCSYTDHPPETIIDPNTKKLSGVYYDIVENMARRLGLHIEWTEEVGYGAINPGFVSGRYDAFCSPIWPTATRAKNSLFTLPIFFSPAFIWVRANDDRFNGDSRALNDANYTISITDGDVTQAIADQAFPLAKHLASTQSADVAQRMEDVASGKADATIVDPELAMGFIANNPNTIKNLSPDKPVRVYPDVIMLPPGEYRLKTMLDTTIGEFYNDGTIEQAVKKYMGDDPPLYFVGKPYAAKTP